VLCIVRYQTFVAQLTGNIVFFGLSIAPAELRETAGVVNNPTLYLCVLLSNICGVGCLRLLQRLTKYPGVGLAIVTLLLMLLGDLIFALVVRSPWCALFFSPCFGAINALSTGPPLSVSVVTMTANTQKLPEWLLECLGNRQWLRVPVGAVLPLPALLGAATGAALLWADDARGTRRIGVQSPSSSPSQRHSCCTMFWRTSRQRVLAARASTHRSTSR